MWRSRSTWACELKWRINQLQKTWLSHAPRERVSWNFFKSRFSVFVWSHAPRERVSWNMPWNAKICVKIVTLHVSVWVEIFAITLDGEWMSSRSTWACELKCQCNVHVLTADNRSRSTWACELKCKSWFWSRGGNLSRSTWACELKYDNVKKREVSCND